MPSLLWDRWLGRLASWRLQQRMLPQLRWNQEIWGETVRRYLGPSVRWLDAGCGWRLLGQGLEPLEAELVNATQNVVGIDSDLPHLGKHVNIHRRVCGSLAVLPFADESFDLLTCNMVVEHLPVPEKIFQELSRVLAPGGVLLVHTPNKWNYLVLANIIAKRLLPRSLIAKLVKDGRSQDDFYPTCYRANSTRALRRIGKSANLGTEFVRMLTHPRPYTRFFAPAAFLELLIMRLTMTQLFGRFGTTIVMAFRKQSSGVRDLANVA